MLIGDIRDRTRATSGDEEHHNRPGVTLIMTPGHTPGHLSVVIASQGRRALLLCDAIICPVRLDEPTCQAIDGRRRPTSPRHVRKRLLREPEDGMMLDAEAHFPELPFGRAPAGQARPSPPWNPPHPPASPDSRANSTALLKRVPQVRILPGALVSTSHFGL